MSHRSSFIAFALGSLMLIGAGCAPAAPPVEETPPTSMPPVVEETPASTPRMTFFVSSTNPGGGGNLGGLAGADAHCQALAAAAGAGDLTWHAYLSAVASPTQPAAAARDRIGSGPWHNAEGVLIAESVADLHGENGLTKQTALSEKGEVVSGRGDAVNLHDIMTGSTADGEPIPGTADTTCANWTSGGTGAAMVGHHDRVGPNDSATATSWNHSHLSRGCSLENLRATGGAGLIYCFATSR